MCLFRLLYPSHSNVCICFIYMYKLRKKKENLSSVSDADREIPIRGSTDNAGNEVYRVSSIIR